MAALTGILGFTNLTSSLWNTAAYIAFIIIIIGVFSDYYRNILFTIGAAVLALYSVAFLHNALFGTLQTLIVISGILQLANIPKYFSTIAMIVLTIAAYLFLAANGTLVDIWALLGSFGLLGLAFGLIVLPRRFGFVIMIIGSILLVLYAFEVKAWVFFFLNIIFAAANIHELQKSSN